MDSIERKTLLHLLRNPWGWSEDTVREARLKAADELERLWRTENAVTELHNEMAAVLVPNA
jgi:hypothetical protein